MPRGGGEGLFLRMAAILFCSLWGLRPPHPGSIGGCAPPYPAVHFWPPKSEPKNRQNQGFGFLFLIGLYQIWNFPATEFRFLSNLQRVYQRYFACRPLKEIPSSPFLSLWFRIIRQAQQIVGRNVIMLADQSDFLRRGGLFPVFHLADMTFCCLNAICQIGLCLIASLSGF